MKKPRSLPRYERYPFEDSPWRQNLTQRDLAHLLGTTKDRLERLINAKDRWTRRREEIIGKKLRRLAIPVGPLRSVHERLKFHLNKIKQPEYLFSPRKGRSQRDNAQEHLGQGQFLSLDIRQFYPQTTSEDIFRWAHHKAGLRSDVAGLLVHLVAVDGRMPFGSPISPVLTTLVHRDMFDAVHEACKLAGLRMSLWVDDLTISGPKITGTLIDEIRAIIRNGGFQTHKVQFRTGGRPVIITGVPILNNQVVAPRWLHTRIQDGYDRLRHDLADSERLLAIDQLLSHLGNCRYHVGASSNQGRKIADRMHALRRRRDRHSAQAPAAPLPNDPDSLANAQLPWD